MGLRPKLYTIDWPLTPAKMENIEEQFKVLFEDLSDNGVFNDDLTAALVNGQLVKFLNGEFVSVAIVPVSQGGTGAVAETNHGLVVGRGTNPLATLPLGTSTQVLTSNGPGTDPTWQAASGGGAAMNTIMTRVVLGI